MVKRSLEVMIGQRFGLLTVVEEGPRYISPSTGKPRRRWRCKCDCGGEALVIATKLKSGHSTSCGCKFAAARWKHGHQEGGKTPTYRTWDAVIARCTNPKHSKFYMYGEQGITVCERWRSFENFLADMGERPGSEFSLDRIDGARGYEPGNCRWASRKQQQRNTRSNHLVTYLGREMTIAEASELAGVVKRGKRAYVYALVNKGISIEEALERVGGRHPVV